MKVLHIGWGFIPWRGGGLIEYAEDLMNIQADNGWDVSYFFAGRYYPFTKTNIKRWKKGKITMFEVINSPIPHAGDLGTIYPKSDLTEKQIENIFRKVLSQVKPDIIHIQELAGFPSSLIEIIKEEHDLPLVMTLHDYFLLCPTLKLFKYSHEICTEQEIKEQCGICCRNAPKDNQFLMLSTFIYYLKKIRLFKPIKRLREIVNNSSQKNQVKTESYTNWEKFKPKNEKLKSDYQNRRETNIDRLKKVDLLISVSHRMEEIYRNFTIDNIITIHSTVKHLELIHAKIIDLNQPLKFATLAGCGSIAKGSQIILKALEILNQRGCTDQFELHIWGGLEKSIKHILDYKNVYYHGPYKLEELDKILNGVNVGILPSIWEEAYGFTGIEFLAKGIPIIGNKRGGIIDYVVDGSTGWVNKTSSGKELAFKMEHIIKVPEEIIDLNRRIVENKELIKSMDTHFIELQDVYLDLINKEGS